MRNTQIISHELVELPALTDFVFIGLQLRKELMTVAESFKANIQRFSFKVSFN
jgi:hypothetical protein